MPCKSANVKNEKQYEALKDKGMSKERAAKIANSPKRRSTAARNRTPVRQEQPGRHDRPAQGRRPQGRQGRSEEALTVTLLAICARTSRRGCL